MRWFAGFALMGVLLSGCGHDDPMKGHAASDLPPGPLQPLPSSSTALPECPELATKPGATQQRSDADFLDITFTNEGADCTVHGYPVLTLRDGSGRAIGDRATFRTNGAARYLDLKSGDSATATVRFPKLKSTCISGTTQIEILIPGAEKRAFIDESHPYCPGWSVTAIHRGSA